MMFNPTTSVRMPLPTGGGMQAPMLGQQDVRNQFNQKFLEVMKRQATDADFEGQAAQQGYTGQPITQDQLNQYFNIAAGQYGPQQMQSVKMPSMPGMPAPLSPPTVSARGPMMQSNLSSSSPVNPIRAAYSGGNQPNTVSNLQANTLPSPVAPTDPMNPRRRKGMLLNTGFGGM